MELQQWKALGSFEYWQGHHIFQVVSKASENRPWLVLIHGFPTASFDFHRIWQGLASRFNLIAFDMLGFGFSDKPAKWCYSVMHQADIVEHLLQVHKCKRAAIVAHDLGDTVAQELLARHNTGQAKFHLDAMVLMNGGLFPETHRALAVQKLLLGPGGPMLARLMSKGNFKASLRKACSDGLNDQDIEDAWTLLNQKKGKLRLPQLIRYIPERIEHRARWVGALQSTQCSLLLINGIEDPISGKHMVDRFAELVPRGHIMRLGGLGHYPHLEDAARVLAPALDFLEVELMQAAQATN